MIVFDFEVFRYDWLVVFDNILTKETITIINDKEKLREFYKNNIDELFIGFNNSRYDNFIFKGILLDKDPYYLSNTIIKDKSNRRIYNMANWNNISLNSYDVSFGLGFTSLKENEAYLGISIDECPIDFNKLEPLTEKEIELVTLYCKQDTSATKSLFQKTINSFETKLYLIYEFGLDKSYMNKSDTAIIERVLGADRKFISFDEFDPFDFSQLNLRIKKYSDIIEHFSKPISNDYKSISYNMEIAGVPHYFGIGGIHGAINNFSYNGKIMILDVASYYPSMMIKYNWFSRSIPEDKKELYAQMKNDRIELKKTNKQLSNAYKLILNTTYGCYKYQYTTLYDPRMANNICIAGQVMMVDLIEQLEPYITLIQSNTDGIIVIPKNEHKIKEISKEWEQRTGMFLEINYGSKIVQKDVNNYVMKTGSGIEAVGGYVKQYNTNSDIRNTMAVVDKAVVEKLINNISIEQYINANNNIADYQIISKVGKMYDKVFIENKDGTQIETNFVNRGFAGFECNRLYKQKRDKRKELVASQPEKYLLWNDYISNLDISQIDKQWYIDKAYSRIDDYKGVKTK